MMRFSVPDILVQIIAAVKMWAQIEIRELGVDVEFAHLFFLIFSKAIWYVWTSKALEATIDFFWFIRHRVFLMCRGKPDYRMGHASESCILHLPSVGIL